MRLDPNKGETIRGFRDLESTVREDAREYYGDSFGKNSFSGNEANRLFLNLAGEQFADLTGISGLGHRGDGRTFVAFDYDRDGWTDIASIHTNAPRLLLFHNEISKLPSAGQRNHISLEFRGGNQSAQISEEFSNRDGYGARVTVEIGDHRLLREHQCGVGVFAQNSARMSIGIGEVGVADRVTVRWPSGKIQVAEKVPAWSNLVADERGGIALTQ